MKKTNFLTIMLGLAMMLGAGCADRMRTSAQLTLNNVRSSISMNKCYDAYNDGRSSMSSNYTDISSEIFETFISKDFGICYENNVKSIAESANSIYTFSDIIGSTQSISGINVYIQNNSQVLQSDIASIAKQKILKGQITIDFSNIGILKEIIGINDENIMSIAYSNSINLLKQKPDQGILYGLLSAIKDANCVGCIKKFKNDMRSIKYDQYMLNSKDFIEFAGSEYTKISSTALPNVHVTFDKSDGIIGFDILNTLKQEKDIRIANSHTQNTVNVKIEKIEYSITNTPDQVNTIIYAQYECEMGLALSMPRGASYLYDYVSGGSRIDYACMIEISKGGKVIRTDVIRDYVSSNYAYCKNARVQNVFGGVYPVNVLANQHMQNQCADNQQRIDISELKKRASQELARKISYAIPK